MSYYRCGGRDWFVILQAECLDNARIKLMRHLKKIGRRDLYAKARSVVVKEVVFDEDGVIFSSVLDRS